MFVKVVEYVNSYQEAIKISCEELEQAGFVTPRYYPAILEKIEEFGPYFCIGENVAMPHARPEDGVIASNACILKLNQPVDFLGNEIKLFITLCAKDSNSHMELIQKIASICMNSDVLNKIMYSDNEEDIRKVV
ncbi:PTS sugar transporter subunit IIA [Candidatus Epulonipiscium fishelsonii]|uniref:PTS sugar transporter subunit IIA n=1 Tax=Candidatus Epulonipiscium fishelsonii TaxID=77094 RepID=A0ACC8XGK0_9FIRM|nr:PTS sugar transporter subunit IIA [Epulopiscium sp. SCG-B05WGA-EpuloA1]ONI42583.1 PTS sugar transporter subunit IIA [Epulopiscium sp. SCG-B11WGA-EpuloA1]